MNNDKVWFAHIKVGGANKMVHCCWNLPAGIFPVYIRIVIWPVSCNSCWFCRIRIPGATAEHVGCKQQRGTKTVLMYIAFHDFVKYTIINNGRLLLLKSNLLFKTIFHPFLLCWIARGSISENLESILSAILSNAG